MINFAAFSSLAHESGEMYFDDINFEKTPYDPIKAYGQSKLANVLFTKELARKGFPSFTRNEKKINENSHSK